MNTNYLITSHSLREYKVLGASGYSLRDYWERFIRFISRELYRDEQDKAKSVEAIFSCPIFGNNKIEWYVPDIYGYNPKISKLSEYDTELRDVIRGELIKKIKSIRQRAIKYLTDRKGKKNSIDRDSLFLSYLYDESRDYEYGCALFFEENNVYVINDQYPVIAGWGIKRIADKDDEDIFYQKYISDLEIKKDPEEEQNENIEVVNYVPFPNQKIQNTDDEITYISIQSSKSDEGINFDFEQESADNDVNDSFENTKTQCIDGIYADDNFDNAEPDDENSKNENTYFADAPEGINSDFDIGGTDNVEENSDCIDDSFDERKPLGKLNESGSETEWYCEKKNVISESKSSENKEKTHRLCLILLGILILLLLLALLLWLLAGRSISNTVFNFGRTETVPSSVDTPSVSTEQINTGSIPSLEGISTGTSSLADGENNTNISAPESDNGKSIHRNTESDKYHGESVGSGSDENSGKGKMTDKRAEQRDSPEIKANKNGLNGVKVVDLDAPNGNYIMDDSTGEKITYDDIIGNSKSADNYDNPHTVKLDGDKKELPCYFSDFEIDLSTRDENGHQIIYSYLVSHQSYRQVSFTVKKDGNMTDCGSVKLINEANYRADFKLDCDEQFASKLPEVSCDFSIPICKGWLNDSGLNVNMHSSQITSCSK